MSAKTKPLTEDQRRKLCELLGQVLLEIRHHGWEGRAAQAADLADAFHNLPAGIWWPDFSLQFLREVHLESYRQKYPGSKWPDYAALIDDIIAMNA